MMSLHCSLLSWNQTGVTGLSSAPEEYQRRQHEFLDVLQSVISIADDIPIFGCGHTKEEADIDHDRNLIVLGRVVQNTIKLTQG